MSTIEKADGALFQFLIGRLQTYLAQLDAQAQVWGFNSS